MRYLVVALMLLMAPTAVDMMSVSWCKLGFGIACIGTEAAIWALAPETGGSTLAATNTVGGLCLVAEGTCKRRAQFDPEKVELHPFPRNIGYYDVIDVDNIITQEEFVFAMTSKFPTLNSEELRKPFTFTDTNKDGVLSEDELKEAPFT